MTRRPAISYRSRWAIYLYYTVLHYRSHIKGDLVERYNFCCYDGRYSCIKLQSCHAISLVKWVKKLNYSLKKCENMFICLILHTNITKIIYFILWFYILRYIGTCTNSFYLLDSVLALISDNFPPSIPLATPWWHLS